MPNNLTSLVLAEVSICDRPANSETDPLTGKKIPRATIALWKRDETPAAGAANLHKGVAMTIEQIQKKQEEQDAALATLKADNEKAIKALKAENDVLKADNLIAKMSANQKAAFEKFTAKQKEDYMAGDTEKRKAMMDGCDKADVDAQKATEQAKKADTERIAKLESDRASDQARITKAETELADVKKRERIQKFTHLAEAELPHTPGTPVEKGETLMELADTFGDDSEKFKKMLGTMKAADAALKPAFTEIGKWGGGAVDAGKALEAKASEIAKRDKVSVAKAMSIAMDENPELYLAYDGGRARTTA